MAAGAFTFTDQGFLGVLNGTIDLDADTIVAVLVDNAHTASVSDATFADISANECADADYTDAHAEGLTVGSLAWSLSSSRNFALDAADLDFDVDDDVDISGRYVYLVRRAGASLVSGDLLVGFIDLNDGGAANVASVAGRFELAWNASGLATVVLTP